jgi:hypothetical protein
MTAWNDFVKKIYQEGHKANPNYQFKQALKDASKRKNEMGSSSAMSGTKKSCMKSCKKACSKKMKGGMNSVSKIAVATKYGGKRTKKRRTHRKH